MSESAPARTGEQTVPTAKPKKQKRKQSASHFDGADLNKDGKIDRQEFDKYMAKHR